MTSLVLAVVVSVAPVDRLELFAGAGVLGSAVGPGSALELGTRFEPAAHLALSVDLGYGVLGAHAMEDRAWLIVSGACTFALARVRLDVGVGTGLGVASGYPDWSSYGSAPFNPGWADQLSPVARLHVAATLPLTPRTRLFARLEAMTLVPVFGLRSNDAQVTFADRSSLFLGLGVQQGVL